MQGFWEKKGKVLGGAFLFVLLLCGFLSAEAVKWRVQSFYPGGAPYDNLISRYFSDTVKKLSKGEVQIVTYGSGSLVPFGETIESVSKGVIEAAIWWPAYETGRERTATIFGGAIPFGLTAEQWFSWFTEYGGMKFIEEMYGKWNIQPVGPLGAGPTQIFLHVKKPARSLDDLKGRTVRLAAIEAEIAKEFGIKPVFLPASEIYTAMERGTIDGCEYASPADNWGLGFHEVAKYIILPGWHSTAAPFFLLVNKDVWNKLSEETRFLIETAAYRTYLHQRAYEILESARAMKRFKDYGCIFVRLPDGDLARLDEVGNKILDKYASENPFFAKVISSVREFKNLMKDLEPLENVSYKVPEKARK